MNDRRLLLWSLGLTVGATLGACAPQIDQAPCDEDKPCPGRGQVCDLETLDCVDAEVDVSSTENPAPASFGGKTIPFFRGEVCTPTEVESGFTMPVLMRPCLHPCITVSSYNFKHSFTCVGSRCEALALMWVVGDGNACPTDAFGAFDQTQCQYGTEIEFGLSTTTSSGPISGTMSLEVPFLSNADIISVAADPSAENIDAHVDQYPQQSNRIVSGRNISILPDNPEPPASCRDGACECFSVGF